MLTSLVRQTSRDGKEKKPITTTTHLQGSKDIGENSERMRYPNNIHDIIKSGRDERRTDNDLMDSHAGDSIMVTFDEDIG